MKSILPKIRKTPGEAQGETDKLMQKAFDSLPREGGALRVFRRDDRGQLKILDVLPRDSVLNPDELLSTLQQQWGGGRYYVVPTKDGKKAGGGFGVEFDGEPKKTKKTADDNTGQKRSGKRTETEKEVALLRDEMRELKDKEREDRLLEHVRQEIEKGVGKRDGSGEIVDSILKNLPQLVTGLSGLMGNRESAADMLEKVSTVWQNMGSSMPQIDPVQQVKATADLIFTIANQSRAPVSATGAVKGASGGGLASFFASLIGEIDRRMGGGLMGGMIGGGPAAGVGLAGLPGAAALPSEAPPAGGLGGLAEKVMQQPEPGQPTNILADFDLKSIGVDPQKWLQQMLLGRGDVEEIARVVVYLLDFLRMFSQPGTPVSNSIQMFLQYPTMMFDRISPLVAELRDAPPEYLSSLRDAIESEVASYVSEQVEQPPPTETPEAKTAMTPEQRQEAQEAASTEPEDAAPKVAGVEPETEAGEEAAQP